MVTITTQTVYTTTIMSQYPIPISLPAPSQDPNSFPSLPERPHSVSTTSTVGSPFSPNPFSAPFTPSHLLDSAIPATPQTSNQQSKPPTLPIYPVVLDPTLLLSARQIKAEFLRRDRVFARTIVGILAGRIELGILSPANGIGFPFSDKEQPKVPPGFEVLVLIHGRRRSRVVDRRDGISKLGSMFIRIGRGIRRCFCLCIKIWKLGGLLWRNLISSRMITGSMSSIVSPCRIRRHLSFFLSHRSCGK